MVLKLKTRGLKFYYDSPDEQGTRRVFFYQKPLAQRKPE